MGHYNCITQNWKFSNNLCVQYRRNLPAIVNAEVNTKEFVLPDFVFVEVPDGSLGFGTIGIGHEAVAAVATAEFHHHSQLVYLPNGLKHRDKLVLKTVAGHFADKYFTS